MQKYNLKRYGTFVTVLRSAIFSGRRQYKCVGSRVWSNISNIDRSLIEKQVFSNSKILRIVTLTNFTIKAGKVGQG